MSPGVVGRAAPLLNSEQLGTIRPVQLLGKVGYGYTILVMTFLTLNPFMGTLEVPVTNCNNLDLISLLKDNTTLQYHCGNNNINTFIYILDFCLTCITMWLGW